MCAGDRAKALALLSSSHPDLVVVDVNGQTLALLDAIRAGEGIAGRVDADTPLIVLTNRCDELHRVRVLERGGDDIIAKPFSYPELRARACGRRAAPSRLSAPAAGAAHRVAHDRHGCPQRARRRSAGRSAGEGVRAARRPRWQPNPACSHGRSCSETYGDTGRRAGRSRATRAD
ncbi:MAG: response regulator transcription factor [Solirubrobacteraceae bacterium]